MIESELTTFALNNGVGVLFGILMYIHADKMRKENATIVQDLKTAINDLSSVLNRKL